MGAAKGGQRIASQGDALWRSRMPIADEMVAEKIAAYLQGRLAIGVLVDWAENALLEGEFTKADARVLAPVVAHLGVADVRALGLVWEDCDLLLRQLGYTARVEIVPAQPSWQP